MGAWSIFIIVLGGGAGQVAASAASFPGLHGTDSYFRELHGPDATFHDLAGPDNSFREINAAD